LALTEYPALIFVQETFATSGTILMVMTVLALIIMILYLFFKKRKVFSTGKTKRYVLKLFGLYFIFALIEQLFFKFVVLESIFYLTEQVILSVLLGSIFFIFFHLQKYPPVQRVLFAGGAFLMEFVHDYVYLSFGNIIWPALSMAMIATFYYAFIFKGDILKFRLG
jgi:hypothetical protein